MTFAPPDQDQRDAIANRLDRTLFVEAGAGSGKSTALVGRVLELVTSGTAELRAIAAITFTEKAASELRDRIRQALETAAERARSEDDALVAERCATAIDQLDGAAIGTLHAFAQRILAEHPIEVELPPRVEILDEVSTDLDFEHRWTGFLDHLLSDPDMERTILLLTATGVSTDALRVLAAEFDRNWDLVEDRVPEVAVAPPHTAEQLTPALDALESALAAITHCTNTDDKLSIRMGEIQAWTAAVRAIEDELDLLDELAGTGTLERPNFKVGNVGVKGNWGCDVVEVRASIRAAGDALDDVKARIADRCAHHVASAIRRFTLDGARARRAEGRLAFHDLLVLARALVSRHPEARARLGQRYQRLLLDEFQDTDPIQIDIAVRIAAADPRSPEASTRPWDQVETRPGQLFFVGDPKQSIYRFRRADISLFMTAADRFGADGGAVTLSTNFRTGAPVIEWVNACFARLLGEAPKTDVPLPSQPRYVPLHAARPAPPTGPPVSIIGREALPKGTAAVLRADEAQQVANTIARIQREGWSVGDGRDPDTGLDRWRPARLGDITVLVPARTSLPFLEDALEQAGIPYRAESSSLVYVSRAIRDLLSVLRAVDDPTDHLAVVTALRSPLFACGDDDLFRFKVHQRGRWNYLAPQPDTVLPGPVPDGLRVLMELHRERTWCSPAELADRIARDRRLFELGFAEGRTRDVWRRLRFVIDQAREWGEATDGNLREYLQWVARQTSEGSRVAEAVLPESDDDAVRIMTIHAAKGLEFPIAIVSGASTAPQSRTALAQVAFPPALPDGSGGGVGYRFGRHVTTTVFEEWVPIDEQMAYDERIRLLYVACTRARDHLVLSVERKVRANTPDPTRRTNAELLVDGTGEELLASLPDAVTPDADRAAVPPSRLPEPPAPFSQWRSELDAALHRGSRPTTVAATALTAEGAPDVARDDAGGELTAAPVAPADPEATQPAEAGLHKRPRDLDLPPWLKGRYGTAVGRAVHGTLQTIDLTTAEGLAGAVAAQCEAEAIIDRAADVERLVRDALATEVVADAARSGAYWREVYACTPIGAGTETGRLLEGYIDLLYRSPDGLVIVDYKTAATNDPEELQRRVAGYRLQGAAYALAVARTTGEPVARVCFAFLTPSGAIERDLEDLDQAMAEVERLVTAGHERVEPEPIRS